MVYSNRPLWKYISDKITRKEQLYLPDVLLLLVEIRRYIEHNHFAEQYPVAKFYCDWALHSETDRNINAVIAIKKINEYLRNPKINYVTQEVFTHVVFDAIQYFEAKKQIEGIIQKMTDTHFEVNLSLMFSILKCVVGIPIIWSNNEKGYSKKAKEQLEEIDKNVDQINADWNQQFPDAILTNLLTAIDNQKRIINLSIENVTDDHVLFIRLLRSDNEAKYIFIKIG